jgi:broad specificity phosphatase PhoE
VRAIFIRHGESTANVDLPGFNVALFELTQRGREQAREVAAAFREPPSLIVVSPYLRTQQTALPTIERFAQVPVETWPIQELTYLSAPRWNGTRQADRLPHVERYWRAADPDYHDGEGAESFSDLLRRCEAALQRLTTQPQTALVYLFSHSHFIHAVRSLVTEPERTDRDRMTGFWDGGAPTVANGERVEFDWSGVWTLRQAAH